MLGFKQIDVWVLAFENFNEKQCKKQRERVKRPQTLSTTYIPKQPLRATASHISFGLFEKSSLKIGMSPLVFVLLSRKYICL